MPKKSQLKLAVNGLVWSPIAEFARALANQLIPASKPNTVFLVKAKPNTVNNNVIAIMIMYWSATFTVVISYF